MTTIMRTDRLALREFTERDLDVVAELMADKQQMSLYPRPRTRDETQDWINRNFRHYEERGFGFWLMEAIEGSHFLGYCGIRPFSIEGTEEIELGWHTKRQFWSQGLATEAATACRDLAFSGFAIPRLIAAIDANNTPSLRVAHKIGMRLEKETVLDGWPCLVYSVAPPTRPDRHT